MHDTFFAHNDALGREDLLRYCAELGLDVDRIEEDLRDGDAQNRVADDEIDARTSELPGTPTFYLGANGSPPVRHIGPYDADTLIAELTRQREAAPDPV